MKLALLALVAASLATSAHAADPVHFNADQFAAHIQQEELYERASLCIVEITDGFLLQGHRDRAAISEAVGFACENTLVQLMPRERAQRVIAETSRDYLNRLDREVARR